jgi:hypothetical protein
MCLNNANVDADGLFMGRDEITVYKVLYRKDDNLYSPPFRCDIPPAPFSEVELHNKVVVSDRPANALTDDEKDANQVYRGIHVYANCDDANRDFGMSGYVIIPCLARKEHYVAHNYERYHIAYVAHNHKRYPIAEAVFMQIQFNKSE